MNFYKIFVFIALILALSVSQSEAGWLKKIGKKIVSEKFFKFLYENFKFEIIKFQLNQERVGQNTRDATVKGLEVAQQAANVAATVRG